MNVGVGWRSRRRSLRRVEPVLIPDRVLFRPDQRVGEADGVDRPAPTQIRQPIRRQDGRARRQSGVQILHLTRHVGPIVDEEQGGAIGGGGLCSFSSCSSSFSKVQFQGKMERQQVVVNDVHDVVGIESLGDESGRSDPVKAQGVEERGGNVDVVEKEA